MAEREIFIGDIQGCFDEWMDLLAKLDYNENKDELYLCGDMINRGPNSLAVMEYLMSHPRIRCILGNHEYFYLTGKKKGGFHKLDKQLGDKKKEIQHFLSRQPYWIEKENWLLVHGGILPEGLGATPVEKLLTLRQLEDGRPWHHAYQGDKLVIYGHWAMQGLHHYGKTWGLDSGCVYGGALSALVLPGESIVSVPARKVHHKIKR